MLCKHEAKPEENHNAEAQSQQKTLRNFVKITPTQIGPRKSSAHLQKTLPWESTSGEQLLHVKRSLKDLIYKKILFTIVKRNLLTIKMNKKQINK